METFPQKLILTAFLWVMAIVHLHNCQLPTIVGVTLATIAVAVTTFVSCVVVDLMKKW